MAVENSVEFDGNAVRKVTQRQKDKLEQARFKREQKIIRLNERDIRRAKRQSIKIGRTMGMVLSTVLVFTLLAVVVQGQVQITEINSQINSYESQLKRLQGTQVQLEMIASGAVDSADVEEYARNNLAMDSVKDSQITYVNIAGEDSATIYNEESAGLFEKILKFFGLA